MVEEPLFARIIDVEPLMSEELAEVVVMLLSMVSSVASSVADEEMGEDVVGTEVVSVVSQGTSDVRKGTSSRARGRLLECCQLANQRRKESAEIAREMHVWRPKVATVLMVELPVVMRR